ncbi:unnamed protein product [Rotaria sp. Silwood1]|nr:unnamed protein product [Rotaria sp. Silwood1]CAF4573928.1 unnamed protein product [Rotaria sp. Silwood1]
MNTTSSPQQPVPLSSDEILLSSSPIVFPSTSPSLLTPSLITRSSIVDHRIKSRTGGVDIDTNKLSTTIKRSQAISNIQDLDEDSPVTFEIEPNEHLHARKKVQLQTNSISISNRTINESISSIDQQQTNSSGCGDESDARSESSEKLPECLEEEKPILSGIHVKGATLNRLIRTLIDSFQSNGTVIDDSEYPKVFFLMHKWIMESEYLSNMLYDLYKHSGDDYRKAININDKRFSKDYQLRICHAYNFWMKNFPMHFDLDKNLKETCEKMKNLIESSGDSECMKLVDLSQLPSFDWMRQMTVRNQIKNKTVSLGFNNIEPQTLAAQLTYLEWKILRRITFTDYKTYAIKNTLQDNPRLERSIQFFNGLSTWIQCMVLSKMTPKQRAEIIHKFLDVAKYLRELQNFNTCLAVIGGISHSALARLSKTMMCLSSEDIKLLTEMTDLLSSNSNYAQYRKNLSECDGFKIPIIGVHLKDIISLHVALQDRLEYDLINFRKLVQLSIIFRTLNNLQVSVPPVQPNHDLINLLTLSLDLSYTEDEIYELSLAREPRSSVSSPDQTSRSLHSGETTNDSSSDTYKKKEQVHSPVFADWAAGVSQTIDIQTIQRHVNAMVEAVFTTYDHDRDGYISHKEFEEIAQNFPFIDTFTVLDADQDGMISKTEMRSYFLRAKYHDLKGEFKHDFHETTYFKPTFCVHCTGLLWGLIKQGWKCKDCGINAHRHCKDQVVMECRQKRQNQVNKQGSVSDSRPSRSSFRIRKTRKQKATQTEDINFSSSTSSSATSESCTSSSDDEQQIINQDKSIHHHHHHQWHLRKPSSLKHRKQILSDSNDEYYYTHPPSPLPQQQLTTTNSNNNSSTNVIPIAQQLIPRGPLICSDSFEKWNDRCFTWNRSLPPPTLLSSAPSTSTGTSESTTSITTTTITTPTKTEINKEQDKTKSFYDQTSFLESNISDDDIIDEKNFIKSNQIQYKDISLTKQRATTTATCKDIGLITSSTFDDDDTCFTTYTNTQPTQTIINFGSSENINLSFRKLSLSESLHSLPTKSEAPQNEIFERLRQAEEEKKRLEVENRAMKQELVRTKSKISSLKREMSSIQQLHLAQQQVQAQLSAPTILSSRQKLEQYHQYHHHPLCQTHPQSSIFTYKTENFDQINSDYDDNKKNISTSSNEESLSPPARINQPTCSVQSTQTTSRSPPSTIINFSNLLLSSSLNTTLNDQQQQTRRSLSLTPSSINCDSSTSLSDEQLRLYLTETLQREKDSAV